MERFAHEPVLLEECLGGLNPRDGLFLDGTLGGGGHAFQLLSRYPAVRLIGIDRDEAAIAAASARLELFGPRFTAIHGNFSEARALLGRAGVQSIDGALLDLGVSSPQFDDASRGFSYNADAPLDMRMDGGQAFNACELINTYPEKELVRVLRVYGEERFAARIAANIVKARQRAPIKSTLELSDLITRSIPAATRRQGPHPARRSFQAIRIEVNDELKPLEGALEDLISLLTPGGRLCVITFHSLEDRIVKQTFAGAANPCTCPPKAPICVCGKKPTVRLISKKPVTAGEEEIGKNARARSAKLRVAEKV